MSTHTIFLPVQYLRQVALQLNSVGVSTEQWLSGSGVDSAQLELETIDLPLDTFKSLVRDSLTLAGESDMSLLVGERILVNAHGILGYAAMNSPSLRHAVDLFQNYLRLRTTLVTLRHEQDDRWFKLVIEEAVPLADIQCPVFEVVALALKNILAYIAPRTKPVQQVSFPFALESRSVALAQDLFECNLLLNQPHCCLYIPIELIDQPLAMADRHSFQVAVTACQQEFDRVTHAESTAAKVRRIMLEKRDGIPALTVVARLLHLTPRTLHRRLQAEDTSYHELRDEVRHKLALAYLSDQQLSLQEIAFTLGYSDMANFRRAFRRWEGLAPSVWRQHSSQPKQTTDLY